MLNYKIKMENLLNFSDDKLYLKIKQLSEIKLLTVKGYNYNSAVLKIQKWWRKWSTLKEIKRLKIKQRKRYAIYIPNTVPSKRKFSEIEETESTEEEEHFEKLEIKEIHKDLFNSIKSQFCEIIYVLLELYNNYKFW